MIVRRDRVQAVEPSDVILEVPRSEEAVERLAGDDDAREGRESLLTKRRKSGRFATDRRADRLHVHPRQIQDRKSTRLNSSHLVISYAVFCLKKKKTPN